MLGNLDEKLSNEFSLRLLTLGDGFMQQKVHIVCGSPNLWLPVQLDGLIVGVDRGALELAQRGVPFAIAVGDFDSISADKLQLIKEVTERLIKLPPEKMITDCEAAIKLVVAEGYRAIYLYGVTGGRIDHQIATTSLMLKYAKQDVLITAVDKKNTFYILKHGKHFLAPTRERYISFFALGEMVKNLQLEGVKYPLNGYDLAIDDSLCVSNEVIDSEVIVSFDTGYLIVVESSD